MEMKIFTKEKSRKVLFVHHNLGLGGIQTKIIEISNRISRESNVNVYIFLKKKEKFDRTSLLKKDIKVIYCPNFFSKFIKNRYYYLMIFLMIILKPSAVFVASEKETIFITKWVKYLRIKSKVVSSVDVHFRKVQQYPNKIVKKNFSKVTSLIAVSRSTFLDFKERLKINEPPLVFIPNWVLNKSKKIKPFSKRTNDIVFFGRLDYPKNPEKIVEFAQIAVDKGLNPKIKIFGEGRLKKNLIRSIDNQSLKNNIKIMTPLLNPFQELINSKFILLTSKHEAMPLVLLEAMNAGCVILSLSAPGIVDLIDDEKTGFCKEKLYDLVNSYIDLNNNKKKYKEIQKNALSKQLSFYSEKNLEKVVKIILDC